MERQLTTREVEAILKRAVELQRESPLAGEDGGLTVSELCDVAGQSGIDPAHVRRAAEELAQAGSATPGHWFLGTSPRVELERPVSVEVQPEAFDALVAEIEDSLGAIGDVRVHGKGFTWTARRGLLAHLRHFGRTGTWKMDSRHPTQVRLVPRGGASRLSAEASLVDSATGVFTGVMTPVSSLGFAAAIVFGVLGLVAPPWAIGIFLASIGGSYGLARAIFRSLAGSRRRVLERMLNRLAEQAEAVATPAMEDAASFEADSTNAARQGEGRGAERREPPPLRAGPNRTRT